MTISQREPESRRLPLLGLVKYLSVYEASGVMDGYEALRRWLRAVPPRDLAVHHSVEHDPDSLSLGIFLQELLVPQFVIIVCWRHSITFIVQR